MAKDRNPFEDLNSQAKQTVDQTKQEVLGAVDNYFNFLQQTVSSFPSGGTDLGEKLKSYAERNVAATHEFLRKVSRAKDFNEMLLIQSEFMQTQMTAFGEQTRAFSEAYSKAAADATKMPFNT
jgi:hypothetical protein